jgi:protein-lysine N-methyltransferase EEF2KMT
MLMTRLGELLSLPIPPETAAIQQKSYVTYYLSLLGQKAEFPGTAPSETINPEITLFEFRSLISAYGTTGFRTWDASIHLGQYLCSQPTIVRGKRILELGAGTGFLSILCSKFLRAAHVIASDGSDDVLINLPDNFFLNNLEGSERVAVMDLKWGHALTGTEEKDWNGGQKVDLVLGADITYDKMGIPALIATLEDLASMFPTSEMLISATQRNLATFDAFRAQCQRTGFEVALIDFKVPPREEQSGPFYNDRTPIHICRLSKRRQGSR